MLILGLPLCRYGTKMKQNPEQKSFFLLISLFLSRFKAGDFLFFRNDL